MLTQGRRIKRKDFPSYTAPKITWNGVAIRVYCYSRVLKNTKASFAVVVSKKKYHTVAGRNRLKRRVFSVLSGVFEDFDHTKFDKFVIFPLGKSEEISFLDIQTDIQAFLTSTR